MNRNYFHFPYLARGETWLNSKFSLLRPVNTKKGKISITQGYKGYEVDLRFVYNKKTFKVMLFSIHVFRVTKSFEKEIKIKTFEMEIKIKSFF